MHEENLKDYVAKITSGDQLSQEEARQAFGIMMAGNATMAQMGGFLSALRLRGESIAEITGAALAMRERMAALIVSPAASQNLMDIVGTGGDKSGSYNISTTSAFVVAACGVNIAKHGNRAASSKSGSADVLGQIGFDLEASFEAISRSIEQAGFGFMLAQRHHGAVRNVMPARIELGIPTIFNFLGPLCNPASVDQAMIGCFDRNYLEKLTESLKALGMRRAYVLNGDGKVDAQGQVTHYLDEVSLSGETHIFCLDQGVISKRILTPEEGGIKRKSNPDILGGDAEYNAKAMMAVLEGVKNDYRNMVLLNSAAALQLAGMVKTLHEGVNMALKAIDKGDALKHLQHAKSITPLK